MSPSKKNDSQLPGYPLAKALQFFRLSPNQYRVMKLIQDCGTVFTTQIKVARGLERRAFVLSRRYPTGLFWALTIAGQAVLDVVRLNGIPGSG